MSYWQSVVLDWSIIGAALAISLGTVAWVRSRPTHCRDLELAHIELREELLGQIERITGISDLMR